MNGRTDVMEERRKNSRIRNIVIARNRPSRMDRTGVLQEIDRNTTRQAAGIGSMAIRGWDDAGDKQ